MDVEPLILRVPSDSHLEALARIVVVESGDSDLLAQYLNAPSAKTVFRADRAVAAIIRSECLNSPDRIAVTDIERSPGHMRVDVQIERYTGPMAANDPWFALMGIQIGEPKAGWNEILLNETTRTFAHLVGGESTPVGAPREERLEFLCT